MSILDYTATRKAKKVHRCDKCNDYIDRGVTYQVVTMPPWMKMIDDVDDDTGRGIVHKIDEWRTYRYHAECFDPREF